MYSCQNEVDQFDPTIFNAPGDYNDALTLIQDLESEMTFENSVGAHVFIDGIYFIIPPEAFIHENGNDVNGSVDVKAVIVHDAQDMIKYDLQSVSSSDAILESTAMLRLMASQSGVTLALSESIKIYLINEGPISSNMYSKANNAVVWNKTQNIVSNGAMTFEFDGEAVDTTGYSFSVSELGWASVQRELTTSSQSTICLDLLDSNTSNNTIGYFIYEGQNAVQRLTISNSVDCGVSMIPQGYNGTILILAHKGLVDNREHIEADKRELSINFMEADVDMTPRFINETELIELIERL